MSSTALATGARQQTVYQPASATPIRVEDHLGLVMHLAKRYAGATRASTSWTWRISTRRGCWG